MMQNPDSPERDWLAFRYISGEMSAAEAEEFEQRLAHDQSAREAVAQMVRLSQAIASRPPESIRTSPPTGPQRPKRLGGIALAAAALSLLMAVCLSGLHTFRAGKTGRSNSSATRVAGPPSVDPAKSQRAEDRIALWMWPESSATNVVEDQSLDDWDLDALELPASGTWPDSEVHVPNWMIAAVSIGHPPDSTDSQPVSPSTLESTLQEN